LRLSEYEHNTLVWPELPAAGVEIGYPVDLAWQNIELRNAAARARLVRTFRDGGPVLRGVRCTGETRRFESFEVMTGCYLDLVDPATGEARAFQLFKDVLVRAGEHKIFRYYFDGE
jgi:hypothetical protein